jgi:hypothetical protein
LGLRIRRLQIRVRAENGLFGTDLAFPDGLVVLQADNTSGKSTCLMAILYALGLEGMLGPSHQPPLPPVMLTEISTDEGLQKVVESFVRVEIEGADGNRVTVQRQATGLLTARQRISVVDGAALSEPGAASQSSRDYFVRTLRSARSELGFHTFLADFIGLRLPTVTKFDGEPTRLYLECIFPFFFVDQLSGWRDLKARMPTYLQIPEMSKRAAEYIMALVILLLSLKREQLREQEEALKRRWENTVKDAKNRMPRIGLVLRGIPDTPPDTWPPDSPPAALVSRDGEWIPLEDYRTELNNRLGQLVLDEIPRAQEVSADALARLQQLNEQLDAQERKFEEQSREMSVVREQLDAIDERLAALREDYRQYEDEKRLRDRGGQGRLKTASGVCPACGQPIKDVLLPQTSPINAMSLEENIAFLRDQIATFREMREDAKRVLDAKEQVIIATRRRIEELRDMVKAQKETLRSEGQMPSVSAIRERLQIESRLAGVEDARHTLAALQAELALMTEQWRSLQEQLSALGAQGLTPADREKIKRLEDSFLSQLREYGFSSYPLDRVNIDPETYRPSHEGFDLGITSASDAIRVVWAYLLALMELARDKPTNHIGLLVFDEPKQQMVADISFEALMKRAAFSSEAGQQVIFATSQEPAAIEGMLRNLPSTLLPLKKWIIRRIEA